MMGWRRLVRLGGEVGLLTWALAGCAPTGDAAGPDRAKVASVVIGRSSRDDVFGALGRPSRTERNAAGEFWTYEWSGRGGRTAAAVQGAATASSVIGAFVPYAGLVGTGIGLAGPRLGGTSKPDTSSLTVQFGPDGTVRECALSSTGLPAGLHGSAGPPVDCQRP